MCRAETAFDTPDPSMANVQSAPKHQIKTALPKTLRVGVRDCLVRPL